MRGFAFWIHKIWWLASACAVSGFVLFFGSFIVVTLVDAYSFVFSIPYNDAYWSGVLLQSAIIAAKLLVGFGIPWLAITALAIVSETTEGSVKKPQEPLRDTGGLE